MNNTTKKRKIQMMEYPTVKINTIKKYDNFQNNNIIVAPAKINKAKRVYKKEIKVVGVNRIKVMNALFYTAVLLIATMTKMWMTYEVSDLVQKKNVVDQKLIEIKYEVEKLENTYIANFDLKQVEKKSKELGFVHNNTIEYVKLSK